jgi:CBS domain-containing protein
LVHRARAWTRPAAVRPEATVAEAARLMDRHQVTCLPVAGENGQLLGVAGPRDLLQIFVRPDAGSRTAGGRGVPRRCGSRSYPRAGAPGRAAEVTIMARLIAVATSVAR